MSSMMRKPAMIGSILVGTAAAMAVASPSAADPSRGAPIVTHERITISYAQLLTEMVAYENSDITHVAIFSSQSDAGPLTDVGKTGSIALASDIAVLAAAKDGKSSVIASTDGTTVTLPLLNLSGARIGVVSLGYVRSGGLDADSALARSLAIRDFLRQLTLKRETLFDPYVKGYDATDTLAQRINQILIARHPDAPTIAIHLTAPGDSKNKVWGINRPNFIGRDSDEIDTDTEKTGRIVMQVIPASHRMEVHMPLLSPEGRTIGTLCTVYFWRTVGEAADFYGRSLSMMEEARGLTPSNRDDLFRP